MSEEAVEEIEISALDMPAEESRLIEVKDIPLAEIEELENIRQSYHGIEGLAETMHLNGQLQPCWVRPAPEGSEKPYQLIFGYRRKRAAEFLRDQGIEGWEDIRCEIREVPDGRELAQVIVENFQREEPSPVAEAHAMQSLKDTLGITNVEVARMLGCDPSQVSHRLRLLKLAAPPPEVTPLIEDGSDQEQPEDPASENHAEESEESEVNEEEQQNLQNVMAEAPEPPEAPKPAYDILEKVDKGEISASVAEVIVGVEDREDQEKLAKLAIQNGWNVKKAANWAKSVKENVADEGSDEMGPIEMVQMEDVKALPRLKPKDDISQLELNRIILYTQLRSYMDREVSDYLESEHGIIYESYWEYVSELNDDEVHDLMRRMALRYIGAAHRFASIETKLKDQMGEVEVVPSMVDDLSLPEGDNVIEFDVDEMFMLPEAE